MRIGIFTESYPPLINSVSTSVRTLLAEIERAGHSVFVFTSHYPRYALFLISRRNAAGSSI